MLSNCSAGEDSSPLNYKEIKPVNPKGNQSWIFIGRTDAEAETLILWPLDAKSQLNWKRPWCWESWGPEENGATEDDMVGWHYWLNGHEFEQTGRQWRTGKPSVLLSVGWQRAGHNWATEQQIIATVIMTQYLPAVFFFVFFFFFNVDHFKSLYWICYNIASVLCNFFGCKGCGILSP